jgi:hypothetical protein
MTPTMRWPRPSCWIASAHGGQGLGVERGEALVDEQAVEPDGARGALDLLAQLERERGQEGLAARQRVGAPPLTRVVVIEHRLRDLVTEVDGATEAAELARHRLEALDRTAQLHRELREARARLAELDSRRAAIEADEQRTLRSERAVPLVAISGCDTIIEPGCSIAARWRATCVSQPDSPRSASAASSRPTTRSDAFATTRRSTSLAVCWAPSSDTPSDRPRSATSSNRSASGDQPVLGAYC